MIRLIEKLIADHIAMVQALHSFCHEDIVKFADVSKTALARGNKILFMGNGGSAADSQHLAAELVGRFEKERRGLPAIALTTDTSILTAVGNDYGFNRVFSRQIEALAVAGDVVVGLSTSGNSPNVVEAIQAAKAVGAVTVGMTGKDGGKLSALCDVCVKVPSAVTARIQEGHIFIGHIICQLIDEA
jgi:D-sedoheptulose 7-phosphate isomerase